MSRDTTADLQSFRTFLQTSRVKVDRSMDAILPGVRLKPSVIHQAMRYTALSEGKRLRPALVLLAYNENKGRSKAIHKVAAALELVHAFSLIHDDLPCMDDDDFRRGQPSSHKVYGEGTAVLAGDALLTEAFRVVASTRRSFGAERVVLLIEELSVATGSRGVIGGQVLDLQSEGKTSSRTTVDFIHRHKTARLFECSLKLGALAAGASKAAVNRYSRFGQAVGLAFQIVDDILGASGTFRELGREPGRDEEREKMTYPSAVGLQKSHRAVDRHLLAAKREIKGFTRQAALFRGFLETIDRRRRDAKGQFLGLSQ